MYAFVIQVYVLLLEKVRLPGGRRRGRVILNTEKYFSVFSMTPRGQVLGVKGSFSRKKGGGSMQVKMQVSKN